MATIATASLSPNTTRRVRESQQERGRPRGVTRKRDDLDSGGGFGFSVHPHFVYESLIHIFYDGLKKRREKKGNRIALALIRNLVLNLRSKGSDFFSHICSVFTPSFFLHILLLLKKRKRAKPPG